MEYTVSRRGYQLKRRPKKYPRTPQQQRFLDALDFCGVKRGISKEELQEKMVRCIPEYHREHKE